LDFGSFKPDVSCPSRQSDKWNGTSNPLDVGLAS
jgi:hypothetical protein